MGGFQDRDKFHPDEVVLTPTEQQALAELTDQDGANESADES
ncbi:hypothetical protein ACIQ9E_07080 [Streptomyces sp. NPDC094448]